MKITIEHEDFAEEGVKTKEPIVIHTNTYFILTDTNTQYSGVDSEFVMMLRAYADKIEKEYRKKRGVE